MSKSIEVGRICKLCGEQVELRVATDGGYYTDDFGALFETTVNDTVIIEAHCGCPNPRKVTLKGAHDPSI